MGEKQTEGTIWLSVINSDRFCEFLQAKATLGNDDMVQGHTILKGVVHNGTLERVPLCIIDPFSLTLIYEVEMHCSVKINCTDGC